jgi:hypothetical protein
MKPVKRQRWTNIDAFGLLNGISTWDNNYLNLKYVRIPDETNIQLRDKINRLRENPVTGTTLQDVVNGLSNELLFNPYNTISRSSFVLSRSPWPSGNVDDEDIWVSYQPPSETGWYDVFPQVWASGTIETPTSGFIVWEDSYFKDPFSGTEKSHNYSKLLTIFDEMPDNSLLRVSYYVQSFDIENNENYRLFTDIAYNKDDDLVFRLPYALTSGDLSDKIVAYNLDEIPEGLSGFYYNDGGSATSNLYKIRDIIDKNYRHKWKDIKNNDTIWDVHRDYSTGVIPSFYDTHVTVNTSGVFNVTGGIEYQDPALYIERIDVQISGGYEYWYPVLSRGMFYCSGIPYTLMENVERSTVEFSGGSGTLPSGIERWHTVTMIDSGIIDHYVNLSGTEVEYMMPMHNYTIPFRTNYNLDNSGYIISDNVYRKKAYITADMGLEVSIDDQEYMIDYDNSVVYASGIDGGTMFWDNIDIPSGHVCTDSLLANGGSADLNPLNDTNVAYDKYFFVLTNSSMDWIE